MQQSMNKTRLMYAQHLYLILAEVGVSALSLYRLIEYLYKKAQVIRLKEKTETKVQVFDTESTSKKLT